MQAIFLMVARRVNLFYIINHQILITNNEWKSI